MKKLIVIFLVFLVLIVNILAQETENAPASEPDLLLENTPKVEDFSILYKISVESLDEQVAIELTGFFPNLQESDLETIFTKEKTDIFINNLLLNPDSFPRTPNTEIAIPDVEQISKIEAIEIALNASVGVGFSVHHKNLSPTGEFQITQSRIIYYFQLTPDTDLVVAPEKSPINFLVSKLYVKPDRLNISILHKNSTKAKAYQLSQKLMRKKGKINKDLENNLSVINITKIPLEGYGRNVIYFRENHYLSAIYLSDILEGIYVMMPFLQPDKKKDTDIEILLIN